MNIYVWFSLLLFLAPGGCPIYSIDLSTLELPNDFQNELTLQSMLNSEMHQYRNRLNSNPKIDAAPQSGRVEDPFEKDELMRSIEDRIKATYYAAASPEQSAVYGSDTTGTKTDGTLTKFLRSPSDDLGFMGTNLFCNYPKKCFSTEDIALMSARRDFEMLIPKSFPQTLLHDGIVYTLMKYFNSVNQVILRMSDDDTRRILQRSFYDALGGYLRYYLLPVAQVSYYAGRLKLCTMQRLVAIFRQCRIVLNTNGNGWRQPALNILKELTSVEIKAIRVNEKQTSECDAASCALLDQNCQSEDDQKAQMLVPLPHLEVEDSEGFLGNIFLPFRHRRIYNLRSTDSAFILVKFYKTLLHCYRFQGVSPDTYNKKLRKWIHENLQLHYRDEIFYPGLGGVLQIYEALITPSPEEKGERTEEDLADEDCHKDYSMPFDDSSCGTGHCEIFYPNKNNPFQRYHKNPRPVAVASRKKSRAADQVEADQGEGKPSEVEVDQKDTYTKNEESSVDESGGKKNPDGTECIDCNDDSLVGYIAIVLGLLLLILLLIIFCCLQSRNKSDSQPKKEPVKITPPTTEKSNVDIESAPSSSQKANTDQSCWQKLFGSRKTEREQKGKRRQRPAGGLSLVASQLHDVTPTLGKFSKAKNMDRQMPRKREGTIFEEESITSTSSLGYQFHRKFIPLKGNQPKRDDYYAKPDKMRSKASAKQASTVYQQEKDQRDRVRHREKDRERDRGRHRERDRERDQERDREGVRERDRDREHRAVIKLPPVCEDHSLERKEVEEKLRRGECVQPVYPQGKQRRQEGGLSEREKEMNPSGSEVSKHSDYSRNMECPDKLNDRDNDKDRKCQDTVINLTPEVSCPELIISETQPEDLEITSQSISSPCRSNGAGESSNKYTGGWETTFDDDSK